MNSVKLKKKYEEDGYLFIKNFFSKKEVNEIYDSFKTTKFISEIVSSPELTSLDISKIIFENTKLLDILKNIIGDDITYFGSGSMIGNKPQNKILWRRMHTDTRGHSNNPNGKTYYDPSKKDWPTFDVFIYMENFEEYSGCLKVVKGSHKKFLPTIGNFIKIFFNISKNWKFDGTYSIKSIPFSYLFKMRNIKSKPGDLFIFNHALNHSPNSLLLKGFENLVLPVFLENFLYKFFPILFKEFSEKRRMISCTFGKKSVELDNFIKSRVQFLSKDYLKESKFFENQEFTDSLRKKKINCDLSLKNLILNNDESGSYFK